MAREHRLLIDGRLTAAEDGAVFDVIDPAREAVAGTAPSASRGDVADAVAAARRAFDDGGWSRDTAMRIECLTQLQNELRSVVEEIRPELVTESGMPTTMAAMVGVDGPIDNLSFWTDLLADYSFERELPPKFIIMGKARRVVAKEAGGVVAAITPWNFPFQLNLTKIGAALAAGCTVVLKPAPDTPWSGSLLAEAVAATDIPPGVVNIVTTPDNSIAEILTTHPDVDHVTFTGSTAVGKQIMRNAAETVKRVSLELGGKSAAIALDEATLADAVGAAAGNVCVHAGQGCAITTRLVVPRSLMSQAAEIAAATVAMIPYGDPHDPGNLMGPVINSKQYERVLGYMKLGATEGRVVAGGGPATQFERGWFVQPTVVADVAWDSRIAQEEVFGPVIVIVAHDGDDDAVRIADSTSYGLSGAVFSSDPERSMSVARRLRTGTVAVDGAQWFDPESPFGGYKQSGIGREWGVEGLEDFLETKTIAYPA